MNVICQKNPTFTQILFKKFWTDNFDQFLFVTKSHITQVVLEYLCKLTCVAVGDLELELMFLDIQMDGMIVLTLSRPGFFGLQQAGGGDKSSPLSKICSDDAVVMKLLLKHLPVGSLGHT